MSGTSTSSNNGTIIVTGPEVIQISDFYVRAGILHPITVGAIAMIVLFSYLRLGSNRSIAPINVFDWVINVALGSILAGIVNGNSLVRGLLGLGTMLAFQPTFGHCISGKMLMKVMKKHRISPADVNAALRHQRVLNICQVDCGIIEPNGSISLFTTKDLEDARVDPDVLMAVPAYKALCEQKSGTGGRCSKVRNGVEETADGGGGKDEANHDMDSIANEAS